MGHNRQLKDNQTFVLHNICRNTYYCRMVHSLTMWHRFGRFFYPLQSVHNRYYICKWPLIQDYVQKESQHHCLD